MKKILSLIVLIIFIPLLISCNSNSKYGFKKIMLGEAFSIFPEVTIVDTEKRLDDISHVSTLLREMISDLDLTFDVIDNDNSLISKVNQMAGISPVTVSNEVIEIIKTAIEVSESTKINGLSLYDISILPVWELWNFSGQYEKEDAIIPTKEQIDAALPLVGYEKIIIDEENSTIFLKDPGMKIDLGSIVKGYACDKIKEILLSEGYENALINVGGNVMTMGYDYYDDRPWRIKISTPFYKYNPFDENSEKQYFVGSFYYHDITVVTSGTYERYIVNDGVSYHHILNPITGYPVDSGLISVSIFTSNSMKADALSTAVFCMGLDKGVEYIEDLDNIDALFITDDKEVYITSGLENNFSFNKEIEPLGYTYKGVYNGVNN